MPSARPALLLASCLLAAGPALAAGCHVDHFTNIIGADTNVSMVAAPGRPCGVRLGASHGMGYSSGGRTPIVVSTPAQHGSAVADEDSHVTYRSAPGYAGPDRFVFERSGESMSRKNGRVTSGTSHYTVDVDVRP